MKTTAVSPVVKFFPQAGVEALIARKPSDTGKPKVACLPPDAPVAHLTPRQLDVLALLCAGMTNKHISRKLGISNATVKIHISCILRALDVTSRLQAVIAAHRLKLTDGEPTSGKMAQPERAPEPRQPITLRIVWDSISAQWQAAAANEPLTVAAV
jgi:DNA-binding CsgD family transcriptional regulator